jgi:hypothetical protein
MALKKIYLARLLCPGAKTTCINFPRTVENLLWMHSAHSRPNPPKIRAEQ